jgi:uncharacterized membrane protein HdeD (DUF308 family)
MNAYGSSVEEILVNEIARHWWLMALRGVAAISFGILTFVWPGITLLTLIILFGAYTFTSGVLSLVMGAEAPARSRRFSSFILPGLISIAAALITFALPGLTALTLLVIIAFWSMAIGVMEVTLAVRLRRVIANEWMLVLAGIVSFLFGTFILIWPGAGALALLWWIGGVSLFFGVMLIALAFRVRHLKGVASNT